MTESHLIRCAVIGVGYLGKFHAEKFAMLPHCRLIGVVDSDHEQAEAIANNHGVTAFTDFRDLIGKVDAVSVVTPTSVHYPIAKACLEQGIHVLVEKPITSRVEHAQDLINTAKDNNCILQVGHLERFNPVLTQLNSALNQPKFIESLRLAPYNPRIKDIDVILDLMIHDIDIILTTVHSDIIRLEVSGTPVLTDQTDIANARLTFANGCVANVTASRISQKIERKMRIFQHDAYISIDFHNRIFSHHQKGCDEMYPGIANIETSKTIYPDGDTLKSEIVDFLDCVITGKEPLVSGEDGLLALKTATRIRELINAQQETEAL